jgi:hypothetical protein
MTDQARAPVEHPLRDVRSQAPAFHPARRQTARAAGAATLVVLCVAEFMIALDFSIVNVALPAIKASLGFSQAALQWVITAYALAFGGLLLLGGRAADLYGRRRLLVGGLALFAAASLLAGLATSPGLLVGMRAVQGAAAAVIAPAALSLLTTTFTEESARRRALGAWGAVLGAGFVTGVVAGGVLTTFLGWRAVFFVNVPIASLAAIATFGVVPEPRAQQTCRPRLDVLGAALATTVVVLTVYAVTGADAAGWFSLQTLGLLAVALLLLSGFLYVESKIDDPLVPLEIFRLRALSNSQRRQHAADRRVRRIRAGRDAVPATSALVQSARHRPDVRGRRRCRIQRRLRCPARGEPTRHDGDPRRRCRHASRGPRAADHPAEARDDPDGGAPRRRRQLR